MRQTAASVRGESPTASIITDSRSEEEFVGVSGAAVAGDVPRTFEELLTTLLDRRTASVVADLPLETMRPCPPEGTRTGRAAISGAGGPFGLPKPIAVAPAIFLGGGARGEASSKGLLPAGGGGGEGVAGPEPLLEWALCTGEAGALGPIRRRTFMGETAGMSSLSEAVAVDNRGRMSRAPCRRSGGGDGLRKRG